MRITVKHDGTLYLTKYTARRGYKNISVYVYDWPSYNKVHVVVCPYGQDTLSFFAEFFSLENALSLLKVYAKAYL